MPESKFNLSPIGAERQKTLADGVFAIVMTLLVLELGVPIVTGESISSGLAHGLLEMWPEFLIYILSFMVLGVFWLMHHAVFDRICYYDGTQAWLNIVFLMFVALIPFSTALFGSYGAERTTALFYGGNLILLFVMLLSLWTYSTSSINKLCEGEIDNNLIRGGKIMGLIYLVLILIAMAISFASPVASFIIYGVLVSTIILLNVLGKGERAYIWSLKSENSN
jgi:uncharacterized membrane protein